MSAAPTSSSEHRVIVEDGIVAGNYTDKYGSTNPVHRKLMAGFHAALDELVEYTGAKTVHEVGCGEGHLSTHLYQKNLKVRGSDFSEQVIDTARKNVEANNIAIEYKVASIYDLAPPDDAAELVVCCEVLEHIDDPQRGLEVLSRLAQPWLLVSVPREPLWRCLNMARGKYITDLGNTPGHLNHWSRASFVRFLSRKVDIVRVRTPLPWTMVLCRARRVT